MKNNNLYQQIKSAKKEERVADYNYYEMEKNYQKELLEAAKPIEEKYQPVLKELKKIAIDKGSNVWHLAGIYRDHAEFSRHAIVNIFAALLSYIEGEKYIPYYTTEALQNSIIIKEETSKQCGENIDYVTLDTLYKNGDLVMLDDGFSSHVSFYDNVGNPNFSFGNFNYLREFVNRLIQYRIDNNLDSKNLDMEKIYSFMCHFISTHPELSEKNKEKREQMFIENNDETALELGYNKLVKMIKK